jgi:hypothetical protein
LVVRAWKSIHVARAHWSSRDSSASSFHAAFELIRVLVVLIVRLPGADLHRPCFSVLVGRFVVLLTADSGIVVVHVR